MSDFNSLHNRAVWFDIPVTDVDRGGVGPHGFRTVVLDSEGNRIALHSSVDA